MCIYTQYKKPLTGKRSRIKMERQQETVSCFSDEKVTPI